MQRAGGRTTCRCRIILVRTEPAGGQAPYQLLQQSSCRSPPCRYGIFPRTVRSYSHSSLSFLGSVFRRRNSIANSGATNALLLLRKEYKQIRAIFTTLSKIQISIDGNTNYVFVKISIVSFINLTRIKTFGLLVGNLPRQHLRHRKGYSLSVLLPLTYAPSTLITSGFVILASFFFGGPDVAEMKRTFSTCELQDVGPIELRAQSSYYMYLASKNPACLI